MEEDSQNLKEKGNYYKKREGLNNIDNKMKIRRSHENESVLKIYEKYLDHPLSPKAHELIHTKYFPKLKENRFDNFRVSEIRKNSSGVWKFKNSALLNFFLN